MNIVNWPLRNKLQWNFNRNLNIFIQENAFENVVCEMASILSRLQCVKLARMNSERNFELWLSAFLTSQWLHHAHCIYHCRLLFLKSWYQTIPSKLFVMCYIKNNAIRDYAERPRPIRRKVRIFMLCSYIPYFYIMYISSIPSNL